MVLGLDKKKTGRRSIRPKTPVWISEILEWRAEWNGYFPPSRIDPALFPLRYISEGVNGVNRLATKG